MTNSNSFDVIIVGGGPAGSLAGLLLSRAGKRVALFEKNEIPKRKICGEYISPIGIHILKKVGLFEELSHFFSSLKGMKIVSPTQEEFECFFPEEETGLSVNRSTFDLYLLNKAKESGVHIFYQEAKEIRQESHQVLLQIDGQLFSSQYLLAADGRSSPISRMFNNTIPYEHDRVALHYYLRPLQVQKRLGQMHLFENGTYIGIDPITHDEVNFTLVTDVENFKTQGGAQKYIKDLMQHSVLNGEYDLSEEIKVQSTISLRHLTKSVVIDRIAFVGDASGFIDPLTGEGMGNALWMADAISQCILSGQPLKKYQDKHRRHFAQKKILNLIFQSIIRKKWAINLIAWYLRKNQQRKNIFVGIIGNIYTPAQGIIKLLTA